jgi:hypothetical protein
MKKSEVLHKPSRDVEYHTRTTGPPIKSRFRHLDGEKLAATTEEFALMKWDVIIWQSNSPWSSPIHMVRKPYGS